MLHQPIRSSKSLLLALGLVAAAALTGCSADSEPSGTTANEPSNVLVTQSDIDKLAPGDFYKVDLSQSNVVYRFDFSKAPIDYSRVKLVHGDAFPLDTELKNIENGSYGNNPKPDPDTAADKRFGLSSDPADFGALTSTQLKELEKTGYFYQTPVGAPTSSPQTTDHCVHPVCVICIDLKTGDLYTWNNDDPYVCYTEVHTFCYP